MLGKIGQVWEKKRNLENKIGWIREKKRIKILGEIGRIWRKEGKRELRKCYWHLRELGEKQQ